MLLFKALLICTLALNLVQTTTNSDGNTLAGLALSINNDVVQKLKPTIIKHLRDSMREL